MKQAITMAIGALAVTALALPASAADLPPVTKAPALTPAPVYNWSGFYIGVGVGGRWTDTTWDTLCLEPISLGTGGCPHDVFAGTTRIRNANPASFDLSGIRGSVYAGYNWQFASWVFGIEGDWGWADNSKTISGIPGTWSATFGPGGDVARVRDNWDASARARIGYLVTPTTLVYATGGGSWLEKEITATCNGTFPFGWCGVPNAQKLTKNYTGWTAGGGIDWMFAPAWVFRAEYRYADYGSSTFQFFNPATGDDFTFTVSQKTHTAYAGLSYLFNWAAPWTDRY